jgi:hypothetical protein
MVDTIGRPEGPELSFQSSPGKGDWDPEPAAGPEGGFLLVWTGNEGVARDVLARRFDARARPLGPMLSVSPKLNEQDYPDVLRLGDGTWVVAWEDDISYRDHTYVRRIDAAGRTMGPERSLNQRVTKFAEHRSAPRIARLGDGFVGVWGDRRRGLGQDVFLRVVGPGFDAPPGAGAAAESGGR